LCVLSAKSANADTTTITLASTTGPGIGQPGVTSITLAASNYPSGTINPNQVQITLTPVTAGTGATASFPPSAITTLYGTSRRLFFTIPTTISVSSPVPYLVSVSGQTASGAAFSSGNSAALTIDPAAQIVSISPNSALAGQPALVVTITSQYTNFTPGSTVVSFGPGIAVGSLNIISPTSLTAVLTISPTAAPGLRAVTVQTGVQVATLINAFTVLAPPAILSVDPNSGYPGQQNLGVVSSIFLTGHDPDFHAYYGGDNAAGAANINKRAIAFITDPAFNTFAAKGIHKFLYVTSNMSPPGGHVDGTNGLIASGYVLGTDFDRADASVLTAALGQLGIAYDALVIASDFGGILTQSELDVLNAHSADIINFLNQGGGLYAMAETVPAEGGLASTGFFGFLPFIVSSLPVGEFEAGNTLTAFGTSLGLAASDINGNYSHNVFTSTGGLNIVDSDSLGEILSLAGRGKVTTGGVGSVIITGQFTHFAQGQTQVGFGAGITVGTIAVADATHLTAQITIAPTALPGGRTVTATTGAEIASLQNGFTVLAPPAISQINPNSGQQGQQGLSVSITGQNTNFGPSTSAKFGPGITVNSLTVNSPTNATVVLNISATSALGPHDVSLTTGTETVKLSGGFTVLPIALPPSFTLSPNSGQQGQQNLSVAISGQNTHFVQGTTIANFGAGVNVTALTVKSPTLATAIVNIDGLSELTPKLTFFPASDYSPNTAAMDAVFGTLGYVINDFEAAALIPGLTVQLSGGVTTTTEVSLPNLLSEDICPGLTSNQAWDGTHVASNQVANQITDCSVNPGLASRTTFYYAPGASSFGIGLSNFQSVVPPSPAYPITNHELFVDGIDIGVIETLAGSAWSPGLTRNTYLRIDATNGNLIRSVGFENLQVASGAVPDFLAYDHLAVLPATVGAHDVTITTSTEVATLAKGFTVVAASPLPEISSVSPNNGSQGQQNLTVVISTQDTNFVQGTTLVNFGAGIKVNTLTVMDATDLTASITLDPDATLGPRAITISTGTEQASSSQGFTVNSPATLSSINPSFSLQGQQNLSVTITGVYTHFVQGKTTANFGAGVTVVSVAVKSSTSAIAVITIDSGAVVGSRDVTLTTGSEIAALTGGFAVTAPSLPPVFTSNPPSGPAWINLTANGPVPAGRDVAGSSPQVYDETNDRLIFFSGDRGNPGSIPADVWVLANASGASGVPTWIQLHPEPGPIGRESHSLTYLAKSNRLVVCGGGSHEGVAADLKDCWVLENANGLGGTPVWTQLPDMPVARGTFSAVYDPASNRLIVFGGTENGAPTVSDTIILENADGTGTPAWITPNVGGALPTGRVNHAAFYDSANNRMVVVGGLYSDTYTTLNDVWALDNANAVGADPHWTQLSPGGAAFTARSAESIVYDQTRNQAFVFGGFSQNKPLATNSVSDLWLLACANGIGCAPQWKLQAPIGGPPIPRALHAAGISTAKELMPITFGRYQTATGAYANLSDTWVLNAEAIASAVGHTFAYQVTAKDPRGESLAFSLVSAPLGMTIDPRTGLLLFTPSSGQLGNQPVSIKVENTDGLNAIQSFNLVVVQTAGGAATITSVVPNVGQAGTTVNVTVNGQNTHFLAGQTNVTFSNGLSGSQNITPLVNSVEVVNLTTLVASVTVQAGSASGPVNVTVATPFETATAVNAFTVQTAAPSASIVSVAPNASAQGTSGSVTIIGQYTHFVQGKTTANFGAGVTVVSVTVKSSTSAVAVLNIGNTAAVGTNNVSVATGAEVATLANGFTVLGPAPVITSQPPKVRNWIKQQIQGTQPAPRNFTGSTPKYDSVNDRLILFSGQELGRGEPCGRELPPDVWILNNATSIAKTPNWVQLVPGNTGPAGRDLDAAVYSHASNRLIIEGGFRSYECGDAFQDTWALSNANGTGGVPMWIRLPDFPSIRSEAGAEFDDTSGNLITFAGLMPNDFDNNDVWVLEHADGNGTPAWVQLAPTGTPPETREQVQTFFDPKSNRLIVFGGVSGQAAGLTFLSDLWALTNANGTGGTPQWIKLTPSGPLPPAVRDGSLVYNSDSNQAILYEGDTDTSPNILSNEAWLLSNANGVGGTPQWSKLQPLGGPPPPRDGFASAYSPLTDRMTIMGGAVGEAGVFTNDVWTLTEPLPGAEEGQMFTYTVQATTGNPNEVLNYSLTAAPEGMTINASTGVLSWTPAASQVEATYTVSIQVKAAFSAAATQTFSLMAHKLNQAPVVNAGGNFETILPNTASLLGRVYDDGFPIGGTLLPTWSQVSGPGTVTFSDPHAITTTPTFSSPGTYVLQLSVTDSELTTVDQVTVTANATNQPPVVYAGPDQTITLPNTAILSGTVEDESLSQGPNGGSLSFAWNKVSGPGTVSITNTASAIAVTCTFTSPGIYVMRFSANDGSLTGTSDLTVTVNPAPTPTITSVIPNSAQQGQQGLSVAITGANTNWVQGTTTATLGAGVTVASLTIKSPTSASAVINIDPAAAVGSRDVTLTTGTEVASLTGGFKVTAPSLPPPSLSSISPTSGQQGQQGLSVAITGANTNFVQGKTTANFGAGVTVVSVTVKSSTSAVAVLNIGNTAAVGTNNVSVATGAEVATLPNGFTVIATTLVPNILGDTPETANVAIVAANLSPGKVTDLNQPITLNFSQLPSSQGFTYEVATTPGYSGRGPVPENRVFTISDGLLDISTISLGLCGSGSIGYTWPGLGDLRTPFSLSFTARVLENDGNPFGFTVLLYTGLESFSVEMGTSQIRLQGLLTSVIDTSGFHNYRLDGQPGSGYEFYVDDVLIFAGPPSFSPADNSDYASVGVYGGEVFFGSGTCGANTHTQMTAFSFQQAQGFVTQQSPLSATRVPVSSSVDYTALFAPNGRPYVNAGPDQTLPFGQSASLAGQVLDDGRPTGWPLTIGWNTLAGPGSVTFANPHAAATTATFSTPGIYTLRLTANDGQYPNYDDVMVTVTPSDGTPQLISLTPASAQRGSTLDVTIIGDSTHFVQGKTSVSFDSDIVVNSVSVSSTTQLMANVSVNAVALSGTRTVVVSTGTEIVALTGVLSIGNGTPALTTLTPNSAQQGQTLTVKIAGSFTGFLPGVTIATFGAGITVASVTVNSPTSASAEITIDPAATPGPRDVTLTTGTEVDTLASGFSVVAVNAPSLTTISPNYGPQGLSGPVGIVGQNTHFAQGATTLDFGPGITVSKIVVGCLTCLNATLSIDPNAALGPRNVTATTGTEVATLANGFTVIANGTTPILTSIVPINVQQGQSVTISITGLYTHFSQGTTQVSFGPGITTTSVSVTSATSLSAQIKVDLAAALGTRTVTVTTGSESESVANVFNVVAATPILYTLNPGGGQQGQQNLTVAITGVSTHFQQGKTAANFGQGVTVISLTVATPTSATAIINIDAAAALGTRTVTLTTGSENASFVNGFTIVAPGPIVSGLNPGGTSQGAQNLSVAITGLNTTWVQGTTTAAFGAGITVASLTITSNTTATAIINVDAAAAIGPRTVTLTTGSEVASFPNGFSIIHGVPGITEIYPANGQQGQKNISVAVTAQYTSFVQGITTANFGAGVTVASLTITSATAATAVVNVDSAASLGARDVIFTTGNEIDKAPGGFTVTAGNPTLLSVSPSAGQAGRQNLSVTLTGQNTHFLQGTTQAFFGAAITINSVTVTSPISVTAVISIDSSAVTGLREVALQTGGEVVSLHNIFNVTAPSPVLLSLDPNTAQQGQQSLSVILTGQYTHFVQGSTVAAFGAGITVASLTVDSPASATAVVNIAPAATVGPRAVTLTTGAESETLAGAFTIQKAVPSLLTVAPNSALQGKTLTVTIAAPSAHFVQGTTKARFGPGVSVGSGLVGDFGPVTVTNSTTATAQLTLLTSAMPAARTVTLQTGSEQLSSDNAFTVLGAPYLLSSVPTHANQGQTVSVTVNGAYTHFVQGSTKASFGAGISVGSGAAGGFGSVTVNSPTSFTAQVTIDAKAVLGPRTITAQTGSEQASTALNFSVLGPITGPGPTVVITSPAEAADVTAPTTVKGTVTSPNLDYWTLSYTAVGATSPTQFATGTTSAVSATFDPTLLLNGDTLITLTGVDTSGQTASVSVNVIVGRNLKIGNFTVSFNDLSVPVAGIPIQVVRTYDSRFKAIGDFGYGWRLDVNVVQITENAVLGRQWVGTSTGGFIPTYCIVSSATHNVTVSLQDGTTYEFAPSFSQNCQQASPPVQVNVSFTPTGITPPNASLAIAGDNLANIDGGPTGLITLLDQDGNLFDPDQYVLTLPDGRQLQLSLQSGLQKLTDLNGNTLTITPSGILSSTGKSVTFQRDAQNRIQTITDPNGNNLNYSYDSNGDLASFIDASHNTSTYTYDTNHDLLTINDPAGVHPIRNDYDANGRLVSHTDAYGNVIAYTNDPNTSQETVTDRLGNLTVNEYDSAGNIVKVTDALGGVTRRTYDANGNLLTQTNALGYKTSYTYDSNNNKTSETDPLGNKTLYTYNSRNQVLKITDANNHVTTNVYDSNGNLTSTTDAAGNKTTYTYNSAGEQTSMTDPLSNVTSYQYDASGSLTQKTDALHHVTAYTYDNNGNKLTETTTRTAGGSLETLVTGYQYDASNRLILTTYPDNSTTQVEYNNIGKQALTVDQLSRQTSYQYDLMGRLLKTTYPDGTSDSATYDAEGDRVTSTDREQRTTTFVYDSLKRLYKTIYPDQSTTQTGYDSIGEVTSVTDALGNVTKYKYDSAGRRTQVTDALSHATTFHYDAVGNQTSMTDANGNTTQYQYDKLNRRTTVLYPDTTTDVTAYDALGRTIGKTDQANVTTQYQYDALGRLIQVTDALSQLTKYAYDELGNRISQTDANNHTTTFAYDKLGRRTERALPAGQSESMTYDPAGNLKTKTDFNGKTTTYEYDSNNNWLTAKIPDASFSAPTVSFTYTATGQRQSMKDASGITNYTYDARDRLTKKVTPEGTLTYTYDFAGNLKSIRSSNANGTSVDYAYDSDNRLSSLKDNRLTAGTTTYTYDNAGNLQSYLYPNGVQTTHTYNSLNRLTNLAIAHAGSPLASYAYQLGPSGNRTQVNELGGRQVNYTYDNLYRLKSETINTSGQIGYQYDPVGNRLQRTSTVAAVPAATYTYDPDDRLNSDTYDANGSTIASNGKTYTYDFENHLTSQTPGQVTITYDGDGNRVSETVAGIITQYLVDDRNLTGYSQVLEELSTGAVQRAYTYGLNRISQTQSTGTTFYGYDGHGSVGMLTDATGTVTDRYDYDAFGNILKHAGTTSNVYLYSGEQNDPSLSLYYLRARYFSQAIGRFWTMDNIEGDPDSPISQHKYTYTGDEPVLRLDPSGNQFDVSSISLDVADFDVLGSSEPTIHAGGLFTKISAWRTASYAYVLPEEWIQRATAFSWLDPNPIPSVCLLTKGTCATFVQTIWHDYVRSIGQKDTLPLTKNWTFGASVEESRPLLTRGTIVATDFNGKYPSRLPKGVAGPNLPHHAGFFLGYDSSGSGFFLLEQAVNVSLVHAPGQVSFKPFGRGITYNVVAQQ
jgi:RHS repeat-associated protein